MTTIEAIDRAAIAAAHALVARQPQAKFLGNIAQSLAPLAPALSFIPGVGTAIAAGIGGLSALGGGGGGGGQQPQQQPGYGGYGGGTNPLSQLAGSLGPSLALNQVANAAYDRANKTTQGAVAQQDRTTQGYVDALRALYSQMQDPALSASATPMFAGGSMPQVEAPQVTSVAGAPVPGYTTAPQPNFMAAAPPTAGPAPTYMPSAAQVPAAQVPAAAAPAAPSGPFRNLDWSSFAMPQHAGAPTGYNAQVAPGVYDYRGPDGVVYRDNYSGEVHPGDIQKNRVGTY